MSYYGWKPYVPVARRRAAAQREMNKLRKKGLIVQPVVIEGRSIARTFWGKGWCDHIESFHDYENRLPRGRTYVRNGSVCHLAIEPGVITAIVSGSELYTIRITIKPLPKKKWDAVKSACAGKIGSLLDLLRGRLASGVMEVVCHRENGLFPLPGEIKFECDCPDWAVMCKHVAAVLYGVGARLDQSPEQLFRLRGVDHEELVDVKAAVKVTESKTSRRRIATSGIADVFGIDLVSEDAPPAETVSEKAASPKPPADEKPRRRGRPRTTKSTVSEPPARKKVKQDATAIAKPRQARTTAKNASVQSREKNVAGKVSRKASETSLPPKPSFPKRLTGAGLRKWRESTEFSQKVLGERLGVSASTISQWEAKERQTLQLREEVLAALQDIWNR